MSSSGDVRALESFLINLIAFFSSQTEPRVENVPAMRRRLIQLTVHFLLFLVCAAGPEFSLPAEQIGFVKYGALLIAAFTQNPTDPTLVLFHQSMGIIMPGCYWLCLKDPPLLYLELAIDPRTQAFWVFPCSLAAFLLGITLRNSPHNLGVWRPFVVWCPNTWRWEARRDWTLV
ncbi:hypothetical protein MKEN_00348200 [Mycena kentingensis (nom. inval.)]|nr:hypothetical protein MKEN_00348200 [Mycena kentingensis (nom. inval.)]